MPVGESEPPRGRRPRTARLALGPRKAPRQSRSRATVSAILDACAQILVQGGYELATTNRIAERAGVSVGTLYEYFSGKEALVAVLAARSFERLVRHMEVAMHEGACLSPFGAVEHMLTAGLRVMLAEEGVFKVLLRQAPFVLLTPEVRQARERLDAISEAVRRSAPRLDLPMPEADAWLISNMLHAAMTEIAFLDVSELYRSVLMRELARLTYRMATGRDPLAEHPLTQRDPGAEKTKHVPKDVLAATGRFS
jgi:AcrR family transcriptional regulator